MFKNKNTYVFLGGAVSAFAVMFLYKKVAVALQANNKQWKANIGEAQIR